MPRLADTSVQKDKAKHPASNDEHIYLRVQIGANTARRLRAIGVKATKGQERCVRLTTKQFANAIGMADKNKEDWPKVSLIRGLLD